MWTISFFKSIYGIYDLYSNKSKDISFEIRRKDISSRIKSFKLRNKESERFLIFQKLEKLWNIWIIFHWRNFFFFENFWKKRYFLTIINWFKLRNKESISWLKMSKLENKDVKNFSSFFCICRTWLYSNKRKDISSENEVKIFLLERKDKNQVIWS